MKKSSKSKTPKELKGVRLSDLYPDNPNDPRQLANLFYAQAAVDNYRAGIKTSNPYAETTWNQPGLYEAQPYGVGNPMYDYGSSVYDDNRPMYNPDALSLLDLRGEEQPWYALLGGGAFKMLTTAATTFVDGTLGLLAGLGTGVYNLTDDDPNTGFWSGIWNNAVTNAMADVLDAMEKVTPNYMTTWELNASVFERMFSGAGAANFWGNDILKNAGFTIGTAATLMLGTGIASTVGKALKIGANTGKAGKVAGWLAKTFASTVGESSIEALNTYRENEKNMMFNLQLRQESLIQQALLDKQKDIEIGVSPDLAEARYQNRLKEIEQDSANYENQMRKELTDASNAVFAANVAVLSVSNNLSLGSLIRGGEKNAKTLWDGLIKKVNGKEVTSTKDIAKGLVKGTLETEGKGVKHGAAKVIGHNLLTATQEGFVEEGTLNLASSTGQIAVLARMNKWARENSTLGSMINPDAAEELGNYTKALGKAYEENFGTATSPGWTEVAAGFITGMFGTPFVGRKASGKTGLTWMGGIKESMEEVYGDSKRDKARAALINELLKSLKFGERAKNAVLQMAIRAKLNKALQDNDVVAYKNAEIEGLVSNALTARKLGILDSYMEMYEQMASNVSDLDVLEIRAAAKDLTTGDSGLDLETDDEIKLTYQEKARKTKDRIQQIIDIYDLHNKHFGDRFAEDTDELTRDYAIREITFKDVSLQNTNERIEQLQGEVEDLEEKQKDSKITLAEKTLLEIKKRDLKRLQKLKERLTKELDAIEKDPKALTDLVKRLLDLARKRGLYQLAEKALAKYSEAKTIKDVSDIYMNSPEDTRDEVFEKAMQQAEPETLELLKQYKEFVEDSKAVKRAIDKVVPPSNPGNIMLNSIYKRMVDSIVESMQNDDSPVLTRENFRDRLKKIIEDTQNQLKERKDLAGAIVALEDNEGYLGIPTDSVQLAKDNGEIGDDDITYNLYNDPETGKPVSVPEYSDLLNDKIEAAFDVYHIQNDLDNLEKINESLDKLDEFRKAGKSAEPKKKKTTSTKTDDDNLFSPDIPEGADSEDDEEVEGELPKSIQDKIEELEGTASDDEKKYIQLSEHKGDSGISYIKYQVTPEGKALSDEEWDRFNNNITYPIANGDRLDQMMSNIERQSGKKRKDGIKKLIEYLEDKVIDLDSIDEIEAFLKKYISDIPKKPVTKKAKDPKKQKEEEEKRRKEAAKHDPSLQGNLFPMFYRPGLKRDGTYNLYKGDDSSRNWVKDNFPHIQEVVDKYLGAVYRKDLDKDVKDRVKVHYVLSADNDKVILLAIKYTDIPGLPKDKADIIKSLDGEEYVVIGTLGYDLGPEGDLNPGTDIMFNKIQDRMHSLFNEERKKDGKESVPYYVSNDDFTNRLKLMTGGYLIRSLENEKQQEYDLNDVLNSLERKGAADDKSPKEAIGDATFIVVLGEENDPTPKFINGDEEKGYNPKDMRPGQVYIMVPQSDGGLMIPTLITPVFWNEFDKSKDTELLRQITEKVEILADPESSDEDKQKAIQDLRTWALKGKENGDLDNNGLLVTSTSNQLHYNSPSHAFYPNSIYITHNGVSEEVIDFDKDKNKEENIKKLWKAIEAINPRMNVRSAVLSTSPSMYLEAGLLRTNLAYFGTRGSDIYLFPVDDDLNYVENKAFSESVPLDVKTRQMFYFNGQKYYRSSKYFYDANGQRIDDDAQLRIIWEISQGTYKKDEIVYKKHKYYEVSGVLYTDNGHGGIVALDDETKEKIKLELDKKKEKDKGNKGFSKNTATGRTKKSLKDVKNEKKNKGKEKKNEKEGRKKDGEDNNEAEESVVTQLINKLRTIEGVPNVFGAKEIKEFIEKNGMEGAQLAIEMLQEMLEIKQKAIADGTFMKAPNGKDTHLTERQWLQVRTQAFKNWFGDWINDPSNASKIVDENGEPKVMFHQTANQFTVFDTSRSEASSVDTATPFGIFLKPTSQNIGVRGDIQMPLFVSMKNPLRASDRAKLEKTIRENSKEYARLQDEYSQKDEELSKRKNQARQEGDFELASQLRKESNKLEEEYAAKLKKEINKFLNDKKYDGIILEQDEGTSGETVSATIALNANQVKSATDNIGTFSTENDDIQMMIKSTTLKGYLYQLGQLKENRNLPFFLTPDGEIYGFVDKEGNIYLDENVISPEHPIHEYTHLWDRVIMKKNPKLWKRGIELMKQQATLWNEIANDPNYGGRWKKAGISESEMDNLVASEVHARLTGKQGELILNDVENQKGKKGIVAKLKLWIAEFWKELKATFSDFTDEDLDNLTWVDFMNMPIRDFAEGISLALQDESEAGEGSNKKIEATDDIIKEKLLLPLVDFLNKSIKDKVSSIVDDIIAGDLTLEEAYLELSKNKQFAEKLSKLASDFADKYDMTLQNVNDLLKQASLDLMETATNVKKDKDESKKNNLKPDDEKPSFVNGTDLLGQKSAEELENLKNSSNFVDKLKKRENRDLSKAFFAHAKKFGNIETKALLEDLLIKLGVDITNDNLQKVLDDFIKCK